MKHDLTNQKFRKLLVVSPAHKLPDGHQAWTCLCDCGKQVVVAGNHLKKPNGTESCGCVRRKHGASRHGSVEPLYRVWLAMRERCNNPLNKAYKNYGGRGIAVCAEWEDYTVFVRDMGERPRGRSLDRIDNNGPYSKQNCRWATTREQAQNSRNARWITFNGETKVLSEWARTFGMPVPTLHAWLRDTGEAEGMQRALRRKG